MKNFKLIEMRVSFFFFLNSKVRLFGTLVDVKQKHFSSMKIIFKYFSQRQTLMD